ncbi:MAG: ATP-binding protein [Dehalococcoidia bacterium]|jgi:hypothetical protein
MSFNPFSKLLGEKLDPEDLNALVTQQVAEGYFVEYKRELPSAQKIAKSIASFANTYGGWYIVGVVTDKHNVATEITGFNPTTYPDPISVVRDVIKNHIDPVPVFFCEVVTLPNGNLVLLLHVPGEQETPFVARDGRIYRRTSDCSEPVPEMSRHALDQLVERGKASSKRFADFAKDLRGFSQSEEQDAWLNIFISPYPFGIVEKREIILESSAVAEILSRSKEPVCIPFGDSRETTVTGNTPFNAVYAGPFSAIFRQMAIGRDAFNSLTMEFDVYARAKLHIPLGYLAFNASTLSDVQSDAVRKLLFDRIIKPNGGQSSYFRPFDIGAIWLTVACLVNFYLSWIKETTLLEGFKVAIEVTNAWRRVAFCDVDSWADHVERFGFPILLHDEVRIPDEEGTGRLFKVGSALWIAICGHVTRAFGLPYEFFENAIYPVMAKASQRGGK